MEQDIDERNHIPAGREREPAEEQRRLFQSILNRYSESVKVATHAERVEVAPLDETVLPPPIDPALRQ